MLVRGSSCVPSQPLKPRTSSSPTTSTASALRMVPGLIGRLPSWMLPRLCVTLASNSRGPAPNGDSTMASASSSSASRATPDSTTAAWSSVFAPTPKVACKRLPLGQSGASTVWNRSCTRWLSTYSVATITPIHSICSATK